MRMLAFYNKKGGVGKSTLCLNYTNYFASNGVKVLVLDLDDQRDFSLYNGSSLAKSDFLHFMKNECKLEDVVYKISDSIHSIHVDDSCACDMYLGSVRNPQQIFNEAIDELLKLDYDFILVDLPPSTSQIAFAALDKCDDIIIPYEPNNASVKGIFDVLGMLRHELRLKDFSKIRQIIVNKYYSNKIVHNSNIRYIEDEIKQMDDQYLLSAVCGQKVPARENINKNTHNIEELNTEVTEIFEKLVQHYMKNVTQVVS